MNYRLQRIDAVQTANVMAVIYGVMMAVIAIVTIPFLLLGLLMAPPGAGGVRGIEGHVRGAGGPAHGPRRGADQFSA